MSQRENSLARPVVDSYTVSWLGTESEGVDNGNLIDQIIALLRHTGHMTLPWELPGLPSWRIFKANTVRYSVVDCEFVASGMV